MWIVSFLEGDLEKPTYTVRLIRNRHDLRRRYSSSSDVEVPGVSCESLTPVGRGIWMIPDHEVDVFTVSIPKMSLSRRLRLAFDNNSKARMDRVRDECLGVGKDRISSIFSNPSTAARAIGNSTWYSSIEFRHSVPGCGPWKRTLFFNEFWLHPDLGGEIIEVGRRVAVTSGMFKNETGTVIGISQTGLAGVQLDRNDQIKIIASAGEIKTMGDVFDKDMPGVISAEVELS